MRSPASLSTLLTLTILLLATGSSHANDTCPLPASSLDQHSALQALQLHDRFATDPNLLPKLKMLLSEDFHLVQRDDGDPPATLMSMDRQAYLDNAKLAAAFSTGIQAKREQVSAQPGDDGLQLRFIETDTGTVMNLPMRIVSRNRANFALQDGCITITAWQFTELSNDEPAEAEAE